MTSLEHGASPPRLSDGDRELALEVLRESVVQGRVSQDTFESRMELVLSARYADELHAVLHDLHTREPEANGMVIRSIGRVSVFRQRLRRAWRAGGLPPLLLPESGPQPMSIGRAPGSLLRLTHFSVSRYHAQLHGTSSGWTLRDLSSSNGTWLNDTRIVGQVVVWPGDEVRFGAVGFRLAAR